MSDVKTDSRRGSARAFDAPLKVADPGARPRHHRASARRDRARDAWLAVVDEVALKPVDRARLVGDAFLQRARAEDYEALVAFAAALRGRA